MANAVDIGYETLLLIKSAPWFPYKTGKLKFEATQGLQMSPSLFCIKFDTTVANYIPFLEEGTGPHNIPGAFGRPLPFGIGGQFDGKFHPGSTKHKGFISNKSVNTIVDYICQRYKGVIVNVNSN